MRSSRNSNDPGIVSRTQAITRGAIHYFTGKPCKRGHIGMRYTDTSNCVQCMKDRVNRERLVIREIRRER